MTRTEIRVFVPAGATSGKLEVAIRGSVLQAGIFNVTPPQLLYRIDVTVSTIAEVDQISNVFVGANGDVLLSTKTQILQLNPDRSTSTIAGIKGISSNLDGPVSVATFGDAYQIVESANGELLVTDVVNKAIRKIAGGELTTYYSDPNFLVLLGMALSPDQSGDLFVADISPYVKKLSTTGTLTTVARYPDITSPVQLYASGNDDYVYASTATSVVKVTSEGVVSQFAGSDIPGMVDGVGGEAKFQYILGMALGVDGYLYVADAENQLIRKISPDAEVTTVCGLYVAEMVDGDASTASFMRPSSLAFDQDGNLLVVDNEETLRMIKLN